MYKHRPGRLLELADFSFGYAVLMVSIDASKGQILFLLMAFFHPLLCFEDSIVHMVCLDCHSSVCCIFFKSSLCLDGLFCRTCLLEINESHSTCLVNEHSCILVTLFRKEAHHLGDQPWYRAHHLVD